MEINGAIYKWLMEIDVITDSDIAARYSMNRLILDEDITKGLQKGIKMVPIIKHLYAQMVISIPFNILMN